MKDLINNINLFKYLTDFKIWIATTTLTAVELVPTEINPYSWISKYIFSDFSFLKWLMIVIFVDLVTGVANVWKNEGVKKVTSRGLSDTVFKVIQYGGFLIVTHIVTHFEIGGQRAFEDIDWVNKMAYQFLLLIEIKSVYENIVKINPKLDFMVSVIEKLSSLVTSKRDANLENFNKPKEDEKTVN